MRLRKPSFEFSSFLFGVIAVGCFVRATRLYGDGGEPDGVWTAMAGGVFLLLAIGCLGWSVWLGSLLKRNREWRLPENGRDAEP
jgi:hypothetical protein